MRRRAPTRGPSYAIACSLALALGMPLACNETKQPEVVDGKSEPAASADSPEAGDDAPPPPEPEPESTGKLGPVVGWLDPDAIAAAVIDLPEKVNFTALSAVFALPPRAEALLEADADVERWLPTFVPADQPPSSWLGRPGLVFTSQFSSGPTVVRPLTKPRDEVAAILDAGEFDKQTIEGFDIWYPKKSFAYRIVLLDERTAAFIPAREPGSGLSPLTAGRDLPPSDLQRELEKSYDAAGSKVYVELYAAGPMMHFDLEPALTGARFELIEFGTGGLEGRVLLQPERNPGGAVDELEARTPDAGNDRIAQLAKAVAYQLDGTFVVGLLQIRPEDVPVLEGL